tara:strand:+ start:501 stop:773 length:273 start_codon:yes stop_codon:yes gene_type:complete
MSLFLVGNVNAKEKKGYVNIEFSYDNNQMVSGGFFKTLNSCKQKLMSDMEQNTANGYRVEFGNKLLGPVVIGYWQNEQTPTYVSQCIELR